jgi:hypothetical protein
MSTATETRAEIADELVVLARRVGKADLERGALLFEDTLYATAEEWANLARITPAALLEDVYQAVASDADDLAKLEANVKELQAEDMQADDGDADEASWRFKLLADDWLGRTLFESVDTEALSLDLLVHVNWCVTNIAVSRAQTFAAAFAGAIAGVGNGASNGEDSTL